MTEDEELCDWITNFLFAFPDTTLDDILIDYKDY